MKDSITQAAFRNRIRRLAVIATWLILWEVISRMISNEILLPGPVLVIGSLVFLVQKTVFWLAIAHSLYKIALGFLLGFFLAVLSGGISCRIRLLKDFLAPAVSVIKSIPVASFIILVLVWVSSKQLSVFISFLVTFPIIYIAILEGYDNVNRELVEMTQVYRVKPMVRLRYLYVSEVLPYLVSAARVAVGMCWKAGISGEIIGLPKNSIGEQLYLSKLYLDISDLFAWTFVIVLVCHGFEKLFFWLLLKLERYLIS